MTKLVRYFAFGEHPSSYNTTSQVLCFDAPRSVPEILRQCYEETEHPWYAELLRRVASKINARLTRQIDKLCPSITVDDIHEVPKHYPIYAFRHVFVRRWVNGNREAFLLTRDCDSVLP